ncbi:Putative protein phosphatase 2C-type [Planctomycetes bacterium MalM25]|nr:Putative protein phosphatase 2C-type [Planctomycetes bacterium MalM25]
MPEPKPSSPALVVRAASRTDVGMRRATNQDSLAVVPEGGDKPIAGDAFLMVADGMGAHAAGELASKMATDTVPLAYLKSAAESAPSALRKAIREANESIHGKGNSSPEFQGMGTTCSCLVITQGAALVGHVGDSRVYRLRDGVLEQLTFDHSLVWEMAAASNVSEDKVPSCIPKNVITRSLGPHETVIVDLEGPHPLKPGDIFLICSDGLTGVVDDTLAGGVLGTMDPDEAAQTLVDLANLRGGPDNISVVVARVEKADSDQPCVHAPLPCDGGPNALGLAAAAACLLACGWFFMQSQTTGMLASAVGLGAALAYAFVMRKPSSEPAPNRSLGGPYGNGPYRRIECGEQAAAAGDLHDLVRELADLESDDDTVRPGGDSHVTSDNGSLNGHFMIDWTPHRPAHEEADAAFERRDYSEAILGYARVVREVVRAAREDDGTHRYKSSAVAPR